MHINANKANANYIGIFPALRRLLVSTLKTSVKTSASPARWLISFVHLHRLWHQTFHLGSSIDTSKRSEHPNNQQNGPGSNPSLAGGHLLPSGHGFVQIDDAMRYSEVLS
jgi:hypothetical protein